MSKKRRKKHPYSDRRVGRRSNTQYKTYLDIIVSSAELRKLIVQRVKDLDIHMYDVVEEAGVNYDTFKLQYLQVKEPLSSPSLRQEAIIKIAKKLGIEIRVSIFTKPIEEVDVKRFKERRKTEYEIRRERYIKNKEFNARHA